MSACNHGYWSLWLIISRTARHHGYPSPCPLVIVDTVHAAVQSPCRPLALVTGCYVNHSPCPAVIMVNGHTAYHSPCPPVTVVTLHHVHWSPWLPVVMSNSGWETDVQTVAVGRCHGDGWWVGPIMRRLVSGVWCLVSGTAWQNRESRRSRPARRIGRSSSAWCTGMYPYVSCLFCHLYFIVYY